MNTKPDAKFKTDTGVESKFADMSGEGHALKRRFGNDEDAKKLSFEAEVVAPNIAELYDDPAAGIREYLSNAETACIRRARAVITENGGTPPKDVMEMLEQAKDYGYDPLIEVTYNRKSESTRLVIEDNGIGISTDEYLVLKSIGYSTSHDEGTQLGQFGMGYMSGFQLSGVHGLFKMFTRSYDTDEAYSTANYITNFEYLDELREGYGTRFEFPSFSEKAQRIDVPSKVCEFTEGMRVPVLYRDFDGDGAETHRSDDFLPTSLEDDYDGFIVKVENEFFEAVMAPESPSGRGTVTYNISMPIRRNTDSYSAGSATWSFDFRGKTERGEIVHCPSTPEIVGRKPVPQTAYDGDSKKIPESEVPDDAIRGPEPASSRDSYESGNDAFWNYVADTLDEEWERMATEAVEGIDSFDDILSLDDSSLVMTALDQFSVSYKGPDKFKESIENRLGVTLNDDFCEKFLSSGENVLLVQEGHSRPSTKAAANYTSIRDLLAADGDVYIGQTISRTKARIVWELGGHVVQCDTDKYDEFTEEWGWNLIKDVKTSNLAERYPDLSDDFIDRWEPSDDKDDNQTTIKQSSQGRNAEYKQIRVRKGTGEKKNCQMKAKRVKETLENGGKVQCGSYSGNARSKLLIFRQKKGRTVRDITPHAGGDVAVAKVPKYVYDYLEGTNNVYTSVDDLRREQALDSYITFSDGYAARLDNLTSDDVLFITTDDIEDHFEDREGDLLDILAENHDVSADRLTFVEQSDFDGTNLLSVDAKILKTRHTSIDHYTKRINLDMAAIKREELFGDLDWDHPAIKRIFEKKYHSFKDDVDDLELLHDFFEEVGADLPTQSDD